MPWNVSCHGIGNDKEIDNYSAGAEYQKPDNNMNSVGPSEFRRPKAPRLKGCVKNNTFLSS